MAAAEGRRLQDPGRCCLVKPPWAHTAKVPAGAPIAQTQLLYYCFASDDICFLRLHPETKTPNPKTCLNCMLDL